MLNKCDDFASFLFQKNPNYRLAACVPNKRINRGSWPKAITQLAMFYPVNALALDDFRTPVALARTG